MKKQYPKARDRIEADEDVLCRSRHGQDETLVQWAIRHNISQGHYRRCECRAIVSTAVEACPACGDTGFVKKPAQRKQ